MNSRLYHELAKAVDTGEPVSKKIALEILNISSAEFPMVMGYANALKQKTFGDSIRLCSITNARSGACSEDCAFCAQSAFHETETSVYSMQSKDKLREVYSESSELPITRFGVVTSGEGLNDDDIDAFCKAMKEGKSNDTDWCSSLGMLTEEQLLKLKEAGLTRFHHNLETAESHFGKICTTHKYSERLEMVRRIKKVGLEICCGGILGVGESLEQRYELAKTLYDEKIDSIPVNFHIPVKGTALEHLETMKPLEILKTVAMFRFVNPTSEIKVAAGRVHLRDLQSMVFYAGATGIMIGDLLTVAGRSVEVDLQMIEDLEVQPKTCEH